VKQLQLYWWSPNQSIRGLASLLKDHPRSVGEIMYRSNKPFSNFGDEFSRLVLSEASGLNVVWAPPSRADVFGLGSILQSLPSTRPVQIWGSGFRDESCVEPDLTNSIHTSLLLRGPLTKGLMQKDLVVPFGDPGLLINELIFKKSPRGKSRVYLPHFAELGSKNGRRHIADFVRAGFSICMPNSSPLEVASVISGSALLVTNSLHGRIFADSLGVPSISLGSRNEPDFKYRDYCLSLGLQFRAQSARDVLEATERGSVEKLINEFPNNQRMNELRWNIRASAKMIAC
jgi:hypothetical protein